MSGLAPLLIVIAAVRLGAQQSDRFSSNSQHSCKTATDAEARRHREAGLEIAGMRRDAQAAYGNERRACRSSDKPCLDAAARRHETVQKQIRSHELEEEARNQRAILDIGVECASVRLPPNHPCPETVAAELATHKRAAANISKQRVDANKDFSLARLRCEKSDDACERAAEAAHVARMRQIATGEQTEFARHRAAMIDLGKCSKTDPPKTDPRTPNDGAGQMPLPEATRQQLLKGAAEMDRLASDAQNYALAGTNRFFKCLVETVSADMKFLAQPAYVPAAQLARSLHEGTWAYLTSDAYRNNRQMFDQALKSLRQLQADPACSFGARAPGAVVDAITHLGSAIAGATAVQKAANAAVRTANAAAERHVTYGAYQGRQGGPTGRKVNPHNPACAPNMCWGSAIAKDLEWETGDPHWAEAFAGNFEVKVVNGVSRTVFNTTSNLTIEMMLSSLYGAKKLKGPALTPKRLEDQKFGRATPMSRQEIIDDLKAAGPDSRGLVLIDTPEGGHVLNARHNGSGVEFPDASNSNMDGSIFFQGATGVRFFRTN
jgi:hypothetical protein